MVGIHTDGNRSVLLNDFPSGREPPDHPDIGRDTSKSVDKIDKLSRIYRRALNVTSGLIKRNAAARID